MPPFPEEIHVGSRPTIIAKFWDDNELLDISGAAEVRFYFEKPDGTTFNQLGALYTDGKDGLGKYDVGAGELDLDGIWKCQAKVTFGPKPFFSQVRRFVVYPNL